MISTALTQKQFDLSEAKAALNALQGSGHNVFEVNDWTFERHHGRVIYITFNDLVDLGKKYPNWPLSKSVDWVLLTKRMWIALAAKTSPNCYQHRLNGLKLLWEAMAQYNLTQLSRDNISLVLEFFLLHGWRQNSVRKNLGIKSYTNFSDTTKLVHWKKIFSDIGLDWIAQGVTESFVKKKLKKVVPLLTDDDLTYADWRQGGSFNLLTLDQGRYYVEHCLDFFQENYPIASALSSTYRSAPDLAESLGGYDLHNFNHALSLILQGCSVEALKSQIPGSARSTLAKIFKLVTQYFNTAYRQARFEAALLSDGTLEECVASFGLETTSENIDRMRVILWDYLRRRDKPETLHLLSDCHKDVPWAIFEEKIVSIEKRSKNEPLPVLSGDYYRSIGLVRRSNRESTYPRQLIDRVAKAGITNFVALTGWRKSELGFPISSIKRTRNDDKLDQYAFPWRYQVDWYVYKTGGRVRELREITFSTCLIAERLQSLLAATNEQPCLYQVSERKNDPFASGDIVSTAVRCLWGHFVSHYSGFKQLDDLASWQAIEKARETNIDLTNSEHKELKRLLSQRSADEWGSFSVDTNLKVAWRRTREELPRIELFLNSKNTSGKKGWLVRYCARTLRADWTAILDEHLPENLKDWLHSLSESELRDSSVSATVTDSLMENTLYPSPHAFRHMWAEAVYRRFDGDAGWMIRSQFKHISRSMWLAYIRDKDNRFGHERAKRQVISSLVHNYLRHQGKGYAGQLHIWLRRLFNKTSVLSPEEQNQLAERLATIEIEAIKANPWGYCLLKRRTRNKAKCSEMGEPMRHNASPDLCLGCVHNLMQSENVDWVLIHVATHVDALQNPVVPDIFKASSYELVKNVTRHVRTLNPLHESLPELQEVLTNYDISRAA